MNYNPVDNSPPPGTYVCRHGQVTRRATQWGTVELTPCLECAAQGVPPAWIIPPTPWRPIWIGPELEAKIARHRELLARAAAALDSLAERTGSDGLYQSLRRDLRAACDRPA